MSNNKISRESNNGLKPQIQHEKEMSFLDHLEELRWHILRYSTVLLGTSFVLFLFQKWLFKSVLFGPIQEDFISYHLVCKISHYFNFGDLLCFSPPFFPKFEVDFGELVHIGIKFSFSAGFVLTFPFFLKELWNFVKPGLYANEKRLTKWVILNCSFLFFSGILMGYFFVTPFAVNFLAGPALPGFVSAPTAKAFLSYLYMFTVAIGLMFVIPLIFYYLGRLGEISSTNLKNHRRHVVVLTLFLAAGLTPPDVITQFIIAIPLYILYECSILILKWTGTAEYQYWSEAP